MRKRIVIDFNTFLVNTINSYFVANNVINRLSIGGSIYISDCRFVLFKTNEKSKQLYFLIQEKDLYSIKIIKKYNKLYLILEVRDYMIFFAEYNRFNTCFLTSKTLEFSEEFTLSLSNNTRIDYLRSHNFVNYLINDDTFYLGKQKHFDDFYDLVMYHIAGYFPVDDLNKEELKKDLLLKFIQDPTCFSERHYGSMNKKVFNLILAFFDIIDRRQQKLIDNNLVFKEFLKLYSKIKELLIIYKYYSKKNVDIKDFLNHILNSFESTFNKIFKVNTNNERSKVLTDFYYKLTKEIYIRQIKSSYITTQLINMYYEKLSGNLSKTFTQLVPLTNRSINNIEMLILDDSKFDMIVENVNKHNQPKIKEGLLLYLEDAKKAREEYKKLRDST